MPPLYYTVEWTRPLVCIVSSETNYENHIPRDYCTHMVHQGMQLNLATRTVHVPGRSFILRNFKLLRRILLCEIVSFYTHRYYNSLFFLLDKLLRRAWAREKMEHFLALTDPTVLEQLENDASRAATAVAGIVGSFLRRHAVSGIAFINFKRPSKSFTKFVDVLRVSCFQLAIFSAKFVV